MVNVKCRMYKFLLLNTNTGVGLKFHNTFELCDKLNISKGTLYNIKNGIHRKHKKDLHHYKIKSIREPYIDKDNIYLK